MGCRGSSEGRCRLRGILWITTEDPGAEMMGIGEAMVVEVDSVGIWVPRVEGTKTEAAIGEAEEEEVIEAGVEVGIVVDGSGYSESMVDCHSGLGTTQAKAKTGKGSSGTERLVRNG